MAEILAFVFFVTTVGYYKAYRTQLRQTINERYRRGQ